MGAEAVVERVEGESYQEAYDTHRDQVSWECGHGGYTGTIAESTGVYLHSEPMLEWDASEAAQRSLDGRGPSDPQKWGPTAAFPIAAPAKSRVKTLTFDVAGLDWDKRRERERQIIRDNKRPGEGVVNVESAKTERTPRVKTAATAGEGERVTVYVVLDPWGKVYRFRDGTEEFPTQAKARAAAVRAAEHAASGSGWGYSREGTWTVEGRIRREGGQPLVTVENTVMKDEVAITVTYGVPSGKLPQAWYLAGIYSS